MINNFIHDAIDRDIAQKTYGERPIYTRFPPEPNGYLHIGHAKSICLNYGTAEKYGGKFNLRFDDTNPVKEDTEYVEAIKADVAWLGAKWDKCLCASDYFDKMYECAVELIRRGKAFVCDMTPDEIRNNRGTLTEPGKPSPWRDRSVEENLALFEAMRDGKYADGEKCLRAKIDMASPNINMRDPVIYRIVHASHHNTGDKWCIYPMYDFAHPLEDAIEGITHSLCTLEFEDHRPLYNWVLESLEWPMPPQQIEFARLNLTNCVMSKRYLKALVDDGVVTGWDDPRMPTIAGLRRRGYTPEAIRAFCDEIGVAKANSLVDIAMLEHFIRADLQPKTESRHVVLDPIKVEIMNWPDDGLEDVELENNKELPEMGSRKVPFGKYLYVEREDFMEIPEKKYFRLFPGNEVRFKGAYFLTCLSCEKDAEGNVVSLKCTYDPATRSGSGFEGRKVKGTIHWVEATTAVPIRVRLYDYLFESDAVDPTRYQANPNSVREVTAMAEPSLADVKDGERFQFFRQGYFIAGRELGAEYPGGPDRGERVFHRIVDLKSSYKPAK